jgi:hypothetical protein
VKFKLSQALQFKNQPVDVAWMIIVGSCGLLTGLWASVILLDDAMITFRVAENLAYGRGFVYNVGERVQVTTTPLYSMLLVPGVWLLGSAPTAALILNIALAALIPVLAYSLGRRFSGRITGISGALLLTLAPLLIIAFSMESYLYVALILATLDAYTARHWQLSGILAGLTALVRGDAALLGACLLVYDVLSQRRFNWRLIFPAVAIPGAWYAMATLYYGSPFPATLSAKTAQGQFNWLGQRFADGFWEYWKQWTGKNGTKTYYLFPALIVIALIPVIRRERSWLIILGRDFLYVTAFIYLAVPTAEWYYAPLMPGVALLAGRGVQALAEGTAWLVNRPFRSGEAAAQQRLSLVSSGVAAILLVILLVTLYPTSASIVAQNPNWKAQVYPITARWIAQNTANTVSLATIDIGHLGYWSRRRIIDIVGLAQPDVAPYIAQGDFGYAIRHYQPELVLLGYTWLPEVQSTQWFQADYAPRRYFKFKDMDAPLVLFSRRSGVKIQPEPLPPAGEIQSLNIDFNRQIRLTGYHLTHPLTPGETASLTLYWQAQAPLQIDFTVFVQLVDAADKIITQGDGKPQDGFYSTNFWQPGEEIIDRHVFALPGHLPPASYDLLVGFYEAPTGYRLQILDEAGQFKADHVRLSGIQVEAP